MRRAMWLGLVVGAAWAPLLLSACVGGDDSGPKPGELGGACLTNGTCNTGLVCTIVGSSALCESPDADVDATADAPADQTSQDGKSDATDAGSDAPYECGAALNIPVSTCSPGYTNCFNATDAGGKVCFVDDNSCNSQWPKNISAHCFQECDGGVSCCASNLSASFSTCPVSLTPTASSSVFSCAQTCASGEVKLCANNAECGSGTCTPAFLPTVPGLSGSVIGICE